MLEIFKLELSTLNTWNCTVIPHKGVHEDYGHFKLALSALNIQFCFLVSLPATKKINIYISYLTPTLTFRVKHEPV